MQKVPKSTYQGARKHHDLWTIRLIMQRNIFYQVKGSRSQRSKSLKKFEVSNLLKLRSVTRVTLQFSALAELQPENVCVCVRPQFSRVTAPRILPKLGQKLKGDE